MSEHEEHDPDLDVVDAIYDAIDRGEFERALESARAARSDYGDDPVTVFLEGVALLELDRPAQAAQTLLCAIELDPEDAEFRANRGLALYRCCRFDEAKREVERALELDARLPDAHMLDGLLLEREGRMDEADRRLERAAALDADAFPRPRRLDGREFEKEVERAADWLPETFRRHLDEVAVTVEPLPAEEILREQAPPLDPELLGLFVGVPLTEQDATSPGGELPPRILLFQRNIERHFPEPNSLRRQIAITLYHELGHYLGLDEDELEEIDLG